MSSLAKVVYPYRNASILCVVMALLSFVCMEIADAQTVIKERIELQPQQGHLQRDSDNDLVYIAEDSGTFAGTVILARKYNPIVTGRLSITRRGTTFEYNLADYLDFYTNIWNITHGPGTTLR